MNEEDLRVFIDGATRYFEQMSESPAKVQTPYLSEEDSRVALEFTGIIGISGAKKGCVYFTAPGAMLKHLLLSIGETETETDHICDLVGEIANTISGNARSHFGPEFMISVPVVITGDSGQIRVPAHLRSFVIPVAWKRYEAAVVICIE